MKNQTGFSPPRLVQGGLRRAVRTRLAGLLMVSACVPFGVAAAEHPGERGHADAHEHDARVAEATEMVETDLAQAAVSVSNARIRLPLPGQTVAVVYLTLNNGASHELTLSAVEVRGSERAELHQHVHEDGMMRMRKVSRVVVPAGSALELSPGGYHIMVFGIVAAPKDATLQRTYPVTLIFENGERTTVNAWPVY